jgi:hypothetical protein
MLHKADGFQRDKQADKEFLEVKKISKENSHPSAAYHTTKF